MAGGPGVSPARRAPTRAQAHSASLKPSGIQAIWQPGPLVERVDPGARDSRMPSQRRRPSRRAAKDAPRNVSGRTARAGAKAKATAQRPEASAKTRLYDAAAMRKVAREVARWKTSTLAPLTAKTPLRQVTFATDSGVAIPPVLTAADRRSEAHEQLGLPGEYPFTRGVQPTMYRGRLWTMRMFAGFGTPEDTNERFKYLLAQGRRASRPPSICRRSWATTPTARWPRARSARAASPSPRCATWRSSSTASRSTRSRPR